ncbi:hypothetical protein QPK87_19060 [Kamptonema cortianum]|nr:hypothetical protein [Geitlerinema splendidum]MDK3158656.1 hypothetical protein [Kamptonema cortianum]
MAKNSDKGFRHGSDDNRSQFQAASRNWAKSNIESGRVVEQEQTASRSKALPMKFDD